MRLRLPLLVATVAVSACSSERLTGPAAQDAARQYQATTMAATTEPLFMLDGKEVAANVVRTMKPESIESIEVLKGKSAAEKYGERGRNGVIFVTTKGAEKGEAR